MMKWTSDPSLVRIWAPVFIGFGVCFGFGRAPVPVNLLLPAPMLVLCVFMTSLAEVHDDGRTFRVKRWWGSVRLAKGDVLSVGPTFLEEIGVLKARRFVFPWGRVFFVHDWSTHQSLANGHAPNRSTEAARRSLAREIIEKLVLLVGAASGFVAGRWARANMLIFRISPMPKFEAAGIVAVLAVACYVVWKKFPGLQFLALYVAAWLLGLMQWRGN